MYLLLRRLLLECRRSGGVRGCDPPGIEADAHGDEKANVLSFLQ